MARIIMIYFQTFPILILDEEEEEILLDEPIPILPGPSGVRPPPLFPRFSNLAEELAEFPFDSDSVYDSKKTLFQLYKGNPKLSYTPRLDMVKLIVTGQSGTRFCVIHLLGANFF